MAKVPEVAGDGVGSSRNRGEFGRRRAAKVPKEERVRFVWGRDQNDNAGKKKISGQRNGE